MNMTMENFDEVIFDDDEFLDDNPEPSKTEDLPEPIEFNNSETDVNNEEDDLTGEVLRLKGILDPNKIKFEDNGVIIERSWDSLSKEEQLNILTELKESIDLSEDELSFIDNLRNLGITINQFLESFNEEPPTRSYKIDELSDEDVYAIDLLEKIGSDNISDQELEEAINIAKQNENLFKKTVEGLRKEYIKLQQDEEAQLANEQLAKLQEDYANFATSIQNEIQSLNTFAGLPLQLSKDDCEELSSFILDLDESGTSAFGKALQNSELFTKAAFWILNELQIIEELTKLMQDNYKRGYETAKSDLQGNKSKLVFNKNPQPKKSENDNFFIDDDEW